MAGIGDKVFYHDGTAVRPAEVIEAKSGDLLDLHVRQMGDPPIVPVSDVPHAEGDQPTEGCWHINP